jgi:hypothetical protein
MARFDFAQARARPRAGEPEIDADGFTLVTRGGAYGQTRGGGVGVARRAFQDAVYWSTRDVDLDTLSEVGCLHSVLIGVNAFRRLKLASPPYLPWYSLVHRSLAALGTFVRSIHAMSPPTVASIPECTARVHAPAAFIDAVFLPAAASGAGRRLTHRRSL